MRVTSKYQESRSDGGHQGIDFGGLKPGAADGMKILSMSGGKVEQVFNNNKTAGNGIVVRMPDGSVIRYLHMKDAPKVKVGDTISLGQNIGRVGNTGDSHGSHLHVDVKDRNGRQVDPMTIINGLSKYAKSGTAENTNNVGKKEGTIVQASNVKQSSYKDMRKTKSDALRAGGYSNYKDNLGKAVNAGKVPIEAVQGITEIIGRESTWDASAQNGRHKGYGQFTPDNIKAYEKKSGMKYSDPVGQIVMTYMYIKDRYGTVEKALIHHDKNNWY